jgi:ABC-2 type transport system permease protein
MPEPVWACLVKEVRYLARSGPKLYVLVMPLFVVFLFTVKNSGLASVGLNRGAYTGFLFSYACAYMQLIFVGMLYNSLGSDGAGVQFYYLSPARFRDAMLAKNLLVIGVIGVEAVLIYAISAFVSAPASAALTCATLAWMAFTILVNISVGNVRSIVSPRAVDASKMRSQNVSGLNGLISLLVVMVCVGLGALTVFGCIYFQASYWVAALAFLVLAGLALAMYLMVLRQLDQIAEEHAEDLIRVLCKS